jgi:fused signal recognition particle receptor
MSFFKKMKERLFKSSSKLDEGLEAIVDEAPEEVDEGIVEEAAPAVPETDAASLSPDPSPKGRGEALKPGLIARVLGGGATKKRVLDDAMLESLEELLITADMGVETALKLSARLAEGRFGKRVSTAEIKQALAGEIAKVLDPVARPLPLYAKRPQVVLVVGVNGSGKTTTIGKLASQLKGAGKSVVIAAGDTFRAAAVEQLQIWGERAGVPVMTAPQNSDPASLAYDAMTRAEADGADILLIDTAGRLQNRADLMEELAKIVRVIRKKDPEAPHNTVLVLHHRPERAFTGRDISEDRRCLGDRDDQARRYRPGRHPGGAGQPLRPADSRHRGGRENRRPGPLRPRRLRPRADRRGGVTGRVIQAPAAGRAAIPPMRSPA